MGRPLTIWEHAQMQGHSRRDFLKSTGALTFSFTLAGKASHALAQAADAKFNAWVSIAADGTVTVMVPVVEMGQGALTSLPVILAEELDADWSKVTMQYAPPVAKVYGNYHPLFQGAMDLWSAGRTDPELREHLVKIERDFDRQTVALARRLFPEAAERPDFEKLIEFAASTIRGLALLDTLHAGRERSRRQWPFCRARLAELFAAER